jgi:signal peptidase I
MSSITAALYGALIVYLGGWFLGHWTGNFSLLLFVLTVVTLVYWLAERLRFKPAREAAAIALEQQDVARRAELAKMGIAKVDGDVQEARAKLLMQPWWLDWTAGLFPVILIVFILRSFLFEPFKIPSGSMIPTLLVGDLILVNKFHYGVRLPVINKKIIDNKRVVGIPGDEVTYTNQVLSINGQKVATVAKGEFYDEDSLRYSPMFSEKLGSVEHQILVDLRRQAYYGPDPKPFPKAENCRYTAEGLTCKVPAGHYFMMGDNRDNSQDSRYWGFVPDENIVGKAFVVWMNFGNFGRIGRFN